MSETIYIYVLREHGDSTVKYVGQTDNPKYRLVGHKSSARASSRNTKEAWIGQVLSSGGDIDMEVIDDCVPEQAGERESYWMNHYRSTGCTLTNTGSAQRRRTKTVFVGKSSYTPDDFDSRLDRMDKLAEAILVKIELNRHEKILQKICDKLGIDLEDNHV